MAKHVFDQVKTCKENMFYKDDKVEIKQARFTINNMPFEIQYGKVNQNDIDDLNLAVLKSLNRGKISPHINQNLPKEGAISNTRQKLNEQMKALVPLLLINVKKPINFELTKDQAHITNPNIVNNMHSLIDILNFIVPESVKKGLLILNNTTIILRIFGDSRNIGRKVQHVMAIVVLLNNIKKLHKPEEYYTLALYSGFENYQSLQNALELLIFDLKNLKESGFYQLNGQYWNIKILKNYVICLNGLDKLKLLHNFNFKNISTQYLLAVKQNQLKKLWDRFAELYNDLHQKEVSGSSFKKKAIKWLEYFLTPSRTSK
ncbi:30485_t:CDS:2 [Gigaspora margarita]|uniref:30485_t:CDS:1 n=1 Tax=Gigaspora margarita TaxID=4874 RepID=A0ABN7WC75_GIGMA|nr:30485_t:CDS:2 [Gigaspora margarita]